MRVLYEDFGEKLKEVDSVSRSGNLISFDGLSFRFDSEEEARDAMYCAMLTETLNLTECEEYKL